MNEKANTAIPNEADATQGHLGAILAIYLIGLLIGGLYVGMVAPVRVVVQNSFGIDDTLGIWMITIYTLFYAALIPVIGKLADTYGRKRAFVICLACFAAGAGICGLSSLWSCGFAVLLGGRILQAVGACGMIPVANAEIATSFPAEKRGMALGLAGATSGVANVLGAGVGSAILGLVGADNWAMLFYVSVPLCLLLAVAAVRFLPNHAAPNGSKLDILGAVLFVCFILALLLSLRAVDFGNPQALAGFEFLLPFALAVFLAFFFFRAERKAADPVFHFEYFRSQPIVITMIVSFLVGCIVISMTLVPEYAEFVMHVPAGSGGYYVIALGIFSMLGPIIAGKLVDSKGPKPVMIGGLSVTVAGFAALGLIAVMEPRAWMLVACLCVVGLGMGFSMGAPTNYMILANTSKDESTAAIATITLIRQMGTTLAPSLYVSFIASGAGAAGYRSMMLCAAFFSAAALLTMLFYRHPK